MTSKQNQEQVATEEFTPEQKQQSATVMAQAVDHHRQGNLATAEEYYRQVLEFEPDHPDANHNLGVVVAQLHDATDGLPLLHKALTLNPGNRQYWLTYAEALIRAAHFKVARNIIELGSKQGMIGAPEVDTLTGKLKHTEQTLPKPTAQEVKTFKKLCRKTDLEPLEKFSRDLIERYPLHGLGYKGLGAVLKKQNSDEALPIMQRAAALLSDDAEVLAELGMLLHKRGQWKETEKYFVQALEFDPELTAVLYHLGRLCHNQMRFDEAEDYLRRALKLEPRPSVYCALGNVLRAASKISESEAVFRKAIDIDPEHADAYCGLGGSLNSQGRMSEALDLLCHAIKLVPDNAGVLSMLLFTLNYHAESGGDLLQKARHYGELVMAAATPFSTWQCASDPQKLRVGMISGDLLSHPVGYFLENLLTHLDRDNIELVAYSTNPIVDKVTARLKPLFADWRPVFTLKDEEIAKRIHADGLHLLIDLSGHTAHNRLAMMAWKPAPVQATWLGYFATTGVGAIDYFVADEVGVPSERQGDFTENIWCLPETRLCFTPPDEEIAVAPLPALQNGHITFGCFQTITKIGDEVLKLWSRVLNQLPDSRLRLQGKQFRDDTVVEQFCRRLEQCGIDPARVTFHGSTSRAEYLAAHAEVDMILDCFPYPGGTTTCEALWAGVPTLTLAGESLIARQGASLLTAAGLPDWVAATADEYVEKAGAFATDIDALAQLRAGLRRQVLASPLFDGERFARDFEKALWGMWQEKKPQQPAVVTAGPPVMNFFNPVFWGTKNPQRFTSLMRQAAEMTNGYHFADNMFVFQRNNSVLNDEPFMDSWKENVVSQSDKAIIWRRYILAMAAFHCSHLEGDFVECGAYQGVGAKTVIDYLGGKDFPKTFWLYDMFEHNEQMVNHAMQGHGPQLYDEVLKRFEGYDNVKIFKGFLPDILKQGSPKKIAYLHIDLNQAPAEIATLDALFDRVVSGGMIVLDDYEMLFYRAQKLAEDDWFGKRGYRVFPLPTSQGFVIKR